MDDDFDNAAALSVLFDAVRTGNRMLDAGEDVSALVAAYDELIDVLGLAEPGRTLADLAEVLGDLGDRFAVTGESPEELVEGLLDARWAARQAQDWARADAIRGDLEGVGILVQDGAGGSRWHRV